MGIQIDGVNKTISSGDRIDFPSSIGVGGTLTYEDVANVDSVGLITARTGINIGPTAGVAGTFFADGSYVTAGVVTATTFYGSGANLTGISAGAGGDTGLDLNDNVKIRLGTGNDIEFYHSGSHNFIDITNGQLRIRHGTDNAIKTIADGAAILYYDGGQRIQTTTGGIEISGETVASSHIKLADNARLKLGTGEDCQFWHNGSHSMLKNQTGRLYILADDIWIKDQDDGDLHAKFVHDDAVELYHNNIKTFQTDGNGIMVYGPEGGTANVYIYADEGDDNADKFQLTVNDGGPFHIQNRKSGSVETNLKCYGDGAVELYHDNSIRAETIADGFKVSYSDDSGATTLKLENNSTANSTNPKVKIAVDLASGKDGGSIEFIREQNYQSSAAADSAIVISPTKNDNNLEIVRINQDWFRLHSNCSGIQFNSDTSSANALNDYEEGSWTPVIAGWDTFTPYTGSSYYAGWYTKVGNLINVGWKIYIQHLTTVSSTAHIRIQGLPFTAKSISAGPVAAPVRFDIPEFGMSGYNLSYMAGNDQTIYMYKHVNGGNNLVAINAAGNRSNVWTMGTATYHTN